MEENKRRQEESIESREQLLRELEEAQRMTAREKSEEARLRREREEEIQAQVEIWKYTFVLLLIVNFPLLSSFTETFRFYTYFLPPTLYLFWSFEIEQITSRREKANEMKQIEREELERERWVW